jgi:serine/threonine-protein kinase
MLKSIQLAAEVENLTNGDVPPLSIPNFEPLISHLNSTQF